MAKVYDRWHKSHPHEDEKPCTRCPSRSRMLVPSRDHGVAMRYQVRWREGTVQRKENFVKLREAQDRAKAIDTDMRRGQYVDVRDQRITFEEYAETWRTAQPHRPGTAKDVEQSLRCYAYPAFGAQRLASIRSSSLEAWATGLVKTQGLAPSTARKVFQKVKAVFNAAVRDGLVLRSPCAGVKLTKVPHTEVVPLTRDEVERLTTAVPDRYRALVVLAAGSGLRPGELFGLQVRHVNFLGRSVKVEQQLQQTTGHGVYVGPPKTERSHRTVPLSKTVLDALERHLERYPAVGDDYLFRMERGGPIVRTDFYGPIWQAAVKAAGLPKGTRMHDLRHTYASLLIRHGEGPKTVAVRLGDSVAVAMRVYAHLWPDEDEGTREAVEDFFAPPPSAPDVPSAAA